MNKSPLTARRLRVLLLVLLILSFVAATAGFLYVRNNLLTYATTVSKLNADAASGNQNLQTLRDLKSELTAQESTIAAARSVLADGSNFSEVVLDKLTVIAKQTGVTITSIDFAADSAAGTAAPAASTPSPMGLPTTSGAGFQSKSVTVTIDSPLPYNTLMEFLKRIETGTLQMQVEGVSLTKDAGNKVSTPALTIKAFVRS